MIVPTRRFLLIFGLVGIGPAVLPALGVGSVGAASWLGFLVAFAGFALFDAWCCLRASELRVHFDLPPILYVGAEDRLRIALESSKRRGGYPLEARVDLNLETLDRAPSRTLALDLAGQGVLEFPLRTIRRGRASVRRLWMRWFSPVGLWRRTTTRDHEGDVPVIPNLRAVRQSAIEFFDRESRVGIKPDRQLGEGSEFDELREYRPGNDPRHIDWKASARHRKLVSRHFRAERNHQVILAFDTGWLMRETIAGVPKIDHGINAGLLLAYVGLKTGDRVGLYSFDAAPGRYVPPRAGVVTLPRLQEAATLLDYSRSETNFTLGLTDLANRLHRRSLVVLITDFVDTVTAELMLDNVQRLVRRHLVLFVGLRDPHLQRLVDRPSESLVDVNVSVQASDHLRERERVFRKLQRLGVRCVDAAPSEVSTDLINRYLEIRRRELVG